MNPETILLMELTKEPMIAYFSMEIGIQSSIPTYSGGLGVLAGDTITIPDARHDYGEDRLITLGRLSGRVVVVVHVARGEHTRIISMRKANAREQEIYQKRLSQD